MHPALQFIEGVELLTAYYGDKLSFHDAEIERIVLRRGNPNLGESFLEIDIHMFAVESKAEDGVHFVFGRHGVASLQFESIEKLELDGFNHQNAIMDLSINPIDPPENGMRFRVAILEAFGVGANFDCYRCSLLEFKEGLPPGSVYAKA